MSEIGVRHATVADVPAITAIYNEAIMTTTASWDLEPVSLDDREAWLKRNTTGRYVTLVAEDNGAVVGFASLGRFRDKAGYEDTVEHTVYLGPEARGKGLGTVLLSALISTARDKGFHAMVGALSADNTVSLQLHRSLGFREVARLPQVGMKFGRWLDLVLVQLVLDERQRPGDPITSG